MMFLESFEHSNPFIEAVTYEDGYLRTRPRVGSTDSKLRRFLERRPLKLKSTGNGSIGIDLTSKKDFM